MYFIVCLSEKRFAGFRAVTSGERVREISYKWWQGGRGRPQNGIFILKAFLNFEWPLCQFFSDALQSCAEY